MAWRVVILGGGFGGLYTARKLEKVLPAGSARVTLINDVNFMLYTPLLPGAAGGTLEPRHVVVPLREQLRETHLKLARVTGADPSRRQVTICSPEGETETLTYDQLVVTLGSTSRTLPIPGLAEHALGFKTLSEAIALRNRLVQTLEHAESIDDDEARHSLLTYVFVGAGYAGRRGPRRAAGLRRRRARALPALPPARRALRARRGARPADARDLARAWPTSPGDELRRRGIEIRLGTTIERVSADSTELSTGEVIPTRTVAWTAGVKPHPIVAELGLPLDDGGPDQGRPLLPGRGLRRRVGDRRRRRGARPGAPRAAVARRPASTRSARAARSAPTSPRRSAPGRKKPFTYKTLGVFVDMGRYQAVAETVGIRWRGFPAWFLARSYHLIA